MKLLRILLLLAALLQPATTHALPGLSPVWERLYNDNQPFSPENPRHQPEADPDGDGFNNQQESIAGTDPFSSEPGQGFPQLHISPHLWLPGQFTLTLPASRPGKNYHLSHSTTLQAGSWTPFPEPLEGWGGELTLDFQPTGTGGGPAPDRAFFRAQITDLPKPGGPYTPWELGILSTHPQIAAALLPVPPSYDSGSGTPPPDPNSDSTGPSDKYDSAPYDNQINWLRNPDAQYLNIPAGIPRIGFKAIDACDTGKILYERTTPLTDPASQPVGYVWDPFVDPGIRFRPLHFNPSNLTLICRKQTNDGEEYTQEAVPITGGGNTEVTLGIKMRAIGDDGSVLADVTYSMQQHGGPSEDAIRSTQANFVVLWLPPGPGGTPCIMLGTGRGLHDDGDRTTRDYTAGFYTDPTTDPPSIYAVTTEQSVHRDPNQSAPLNLRRTKTEDQSVSYLPGHPSRRGTPTPAPKITRTGKVLLADKQNGVPQWILCGNGPYLVIPENLYPKTLSDLPDGTGTPWQGDATPWGIGREGQPFLARTGDSYQPLSSAPLVLQWDRWGIGIGPSAAQAIWRNGRMHTLAEVTGSSNWGNVYPRKITPSGLLWVSDALGQANSILIPVEVIAPDLNYLEGPTGQGLLGAHELKVAKMEYSLTSDGLDIDEDRHRFHINIPVSLIGEEPVQAYLATVGNSEPSYNDPATLITLLPTDGTSMRSPSQMLVSDEVDDAADGADERVDDRTHRIQLGGKVEISSVKIGGTTYSLGMLIPVEAKRTVDVKVVILREVIGGEPVVSQENAEGDLRRAEERYAQIGLKINWSIKIEDPPEGVNLSDGITEFLDPSYPTAEESALLTSNLATPDTNDIQVYFVNHLSPPPGSQGEAFISSISGPLYGGNIIISSKRGPFTAAHELGHILKNDGNHSLNPLHLMRGNGTSQQNSVGSSKRLTFSEERTIKRSKYAK